MAILQNNGDITIVGSGASGGSAEPNMGSSLVSGNAVDTEIDSANTFTDLNLGAAAVLGVNSVGWSLNSSTTGELTYNGTPDFTGAITASITALSVSSSGSFRFRAVKNGSEIMSEARTTITLVNSLFRGLTLVVPVTAVTGDDLRIQVENVSTAGDVLIVNYVMNVA